MTPEEMDRAIEFLIWQQAEFAAGMQQLRDEHAESYRRLSDAILTLTGVVGRRDERLSEAQANADQRIAELAVQGKETDARLAELTDRLNAFIVYVERYIEETRNGKNRN